jgi:hypothetical protein
MILIMFQMENIKEENIRQNNAEEVCNPTHERTRKEKFIKLLKTSIVLTNTKNLIGLL